MKAKILLLVLYIFPLVQMYGQEMSDTVVVQENYTAETPKSWELRGSIRGLAKVYSESPNEVDLLESRLKLELISAMGKKSAFRTLGYAVCQYPEKQLKLDLKEAYIDYYTKYIVPVS